MKFSTREDIEAPIDVVFAHITDFAAYERQALRRGASVQRLDGDGPVEVGAAWEVKFAFRGKERTMRLSLDQMDEQGLEIASTAGGLDGQSEVTLVALSPKRTRLAIGIELKARTLTARLLLQSLKLAKANLNQRFKKRVSELASDIEARYRAS